MNVLLDKLKNDTLSGIFDAGVKTWILGVIANIMQSLFLLLALVPLVLFTLGISLDDMIQIYNMTQDPINNQAALENFGFRMVQDAGGRLIGVVLLFIMITLFFSSWAYYVAILAVRDLVNGNGVNIGRILSESFNGKVIKIFLLTLLICLVSFIAAFILSLVSGLFSSMIPALGVLVGIAGAFCLGAYLWRLSLAMPIIVYENVTISDSISKAMDAFSFGKGMKYMVLTILAFVALAVVSLVLGLVTNIFGSVPEVGMIIGFIVNTALGGFILVLSGALMVSMYYKYHAKLDPGDNNVEDHLIYNN